jgi:O-antigen/teichoic acid export membrane protein
VSRLAFSSAAALMGGRAFTMGLGLLGVPILLANLGDKQFAAWAVLTGGSLVFYCLEMAMPVTLVRFLARDVTPDARDTEVHLHTNALAVMVTLYGGGLAAAVALAAVVAQWLGLPPTPLFSAGGLIVIVCAATALTSLLKLGLAGLDARGRFHMVAAIAAFQIGAANVATWVVAYKWHRLDLVVITYWGVQLLVLLAGNVLLSHAAPRGLALRQLRGSTMATLLRHGFFLQFTTLVYLAHFQLDKTFISAFTGLSEVARYEVGARPAQALRNLPGGAMRMFLPAVAKRELQDARGLYLRMTTATCYGVLVFLLMPLTIAQFFLFAWAGEIGYHGRWVFLWIGSALCVDLMIAPVSSFIQALGRTDLEAAMVFRGLVVHLALAALLIGRFGKNGAAAACAAGMVFAHVYYVRRFHRLMEWRLVETLQALEREFRPGLLVCAIAFAMAALVRPWVIVSRWYMAAATLVFYGSALGALAVIYRDRLRAALSELVPPEPPEGVLGYARAAITAAPPAQ